jgi:dTDP-4-dehydrorhamnose reductase
MLRFAKEGKELKITTEQIGTPTNANDLALALVKIIESKSNNYGIYHFSNDGEATWYDFAKEIFLQTNQLNRTSLVKTEEYITFAARPKFSVMDCNKIRHAFNLKNTKWLNSLNKLIIKSN